MNSYGRGMFSNGVRGQSTSNSGAIPYGREMVLSPSRNVGDAPWFRTLQSININAACCITLDRERCLPEFMHVYFLKLPSLSGISNEVQKGQSCQARI